MLSQPTIKGVALMTLVAILAIAMFAFVQDQRSPATEQAHAGHDHADAVGEVEVPHGTTYLSYDVPPTEPAALADESDAILFATVDSVGPQYSEAQDAIEVSPQGPPVQDVTATLTEAPIKGTQQQGDQVTLQRGIIDGGAVPQAGQRYLFFANNDTDSPKLVVNSQPYGEKPAADQAQRDALYQTYNPVATDGQTYEPPADTTSPTGRDITDPLKQVCTQDAPSGCVPGESVEGVEPVQK